LLNWRIIQSGHQPDAGYYYCQQPGSPGWPQQFFKFNSLKVLFFISIVSFFVSGIGLEILLTASLIFGFFFLAHIRLLILKMYCIVFNSNL